MTLSTESVLSELADTDEDVKALFDLEAVTNRRLIGEQGGLPGIGIDELVFGVPNFRLINVAFAFAGPSGSRINGPDRGCWYASFDLETALAEVVFHKCELNDLRADDAFLSSLDPNDYRASQELSANLYNEGSLGIIYPSVRHVTGANIACFRPALVGNVRRGSSHKVTWDGAATPKVLHL